MKTRKWIIPVLVVLILSLMLAGCEPAEENGAAEPGLEELFEEELPTGEPAVDEPLEGETTAEFGEFGVADAEVGMMVASDMLGLDIANPKGADLGNVEDLLIDVASGNILFARVAYGGFLDIGDEDVMVPLPALEWDSEDEVFVLIVEEAILEQWPDLEEEWPAVTDPAWDDEVVAFWEDAGIDVFWDPVIEINTVTWASELMDSDIDFEAETAIGTVDDLVVELSQGRAKYVLLSFDEGLAGEEVRAVPFSAFDVSAVADGEFVIEPAIDLDTLAATPSIGSDSFADVIIFNEAWDNDLDLFWEELGYPVAADTEEPS